MNEYKVGKEYLLRWQAETKKGEKESVVTFVNFLPKGHLFTYSYYVHIYQAHPGKRNPPTELRTDILVFKRTDGSHVIIPVTENMEKTVIIQEAV